MNPEAANILAEGFLKGALDVFEAMLSAACQYTLGQASELSGERLEQYAGSFPVALQGRIKNNLGAVALLFDLDTASRLAAMIQEAPAEPKAALSDEDRALLKEVADPALGGGVTNLMERFGRSVEQLDLVEVADASASALAGLLGPNATGMTFDFQMGAVSGSAVCAFSRTLEDLVPKDLLRGSAANDLGTAAALSSEEMSDILSGFGAPAAAGAPMMPRTPRPENLDMVLDIQLTAVARLGRVEMPIGDILSLGPGSIVEVGHLVDEPIELLINDKLIARGDVVVVDEKFGLRITEVISPQGRIESMR